MRKKPLGSLEELLLGSLCREACGHLSAGACANIQVDQNAYRFVVTKKGGHVSAGFADDADFTVSLSSNALSHLSAVAEKESATLGDLGVTLLQGLVSKDPQRALELKIHAGAWQLWQRGYLGLAFAGGKPVLAMLASHGLSNAKQILELLKKMRSP